MKNNDELWDELIRREVYFSLLMFHVFVAMAEYGQHLTRIPSEHARKAAQEIYDELPEVLKRGLIRPKDPS